MATRRCLQALKIRCYSTSFNNLNPFIHPLLNYPTPNFPLTTLKSVEKLSPSKTCNSAPFLAPFSLYCRNFCSNNRIDNSDDDEDEDDGSEVEGSEVEEEEEEKENVQGKSDEQKAKEAAEIGYKVVGPLEKSDRVFKPYEPVFAVVQIGSHQFKVSNGDSIYTERLKYCDVNDKLTLNKVLMLGSATQTMIGRPVLPDASVHAVVEEHALDAKVIIFKKKRRKNYRRTRGHRQELTKLRITDIEGIEKTEVKPSPKTEKTEVKPTLRTEKTAGTKSKKAPVAV